MEELKPCPFCGGETLVGYSDDEGNRRDDDYANDPWSGLTFVLIHDNEFNPSCPVASHWGEILGTSLYDSKEEAIKAWNQRK